MALVEPEDPNSDAAGPLEPNSSAEDFFSKMNHDFRRPKPSDEAIAAALQSIQALAGDGAIEGGEIVPVEHASGSQLDAECAKCGGVNSGSNRFCGFCGATLEMRGTDTPGMESGSRTAPRVTGRSRQAASEQHVHHHHYHHHYFSSGPQPAQNAADVPGYHFRPATDSLSADESPVPIGADAILRKLVQEWVLLCNGKRVDELVALYASDAVMIRPGVATARGHAAIKELLQADLEAGLGDVQLECSDVGTLGDVACLTGVNRMLTPVSPANRQEYTGKFLMVVRRVGANWGIVADIWCVDGRQSARPAARPGK